MKFYKVNYDYFMDYVKLHNLEFRQDGMGSLYYNSNTR